MNIDPSAYSAVHYRDFSSLLEITGSHKEAIFLDKIVFWFKTSTFNLPRSSDSRIWFTRTYEQMSSEIKIPVSTLKRYMKKFDTLGLIERVQKKVGFNVRAYFTVTEVLLSKIKKDTSKSNIKNLRKNDTIENSKMKFSYNKDHRNKIINTNFISEIKGNPNLVEKVRMKLLSIAKNISNPKQLQEEVLESISNPEYLSTATTFNHRINIILKLIRTGKWRSPTKKKEEKLKTKTKEKLVNKNMEKKLNLKLSSINGEIKSLNTLSKFDSRLELQIDKLKRNRNALLLKINKNQK